MFPVLKWFCIFLITSTYLNAEIPVITDEEPYLITRIVDAEYPMENRTYENQDYTATFFGFHITVQIENPSSENISYDYWGWPYPFPLFDYWVLNESLIVEYDLIINMVDGFSHYEPGEIRTMEVAISIIIYHFEEKILPIGWFKFWFDFAVVCEVWVPVITYGLYIHSLTDRIVYNYEHDNSSEIYEKPSTATTSTSTADASYGLFPFMLIAFSHLLLTKRFLMSKIKRKSSQ